MRVGIMSMQRIVNYGSYFQAYGLKSMLEELGAEVCFVDYAVDMTIDLIKYYDQAQYKRLRLLKRKIRMLKQPEQNTKIPGCFLDCYPQLGIDEKKHYHTKVDTLVIGSDEVFNCLQTNKDVGYSLELFGKRNRAKRLISYAASFGDTTLLRLKEHDVDKEVSKYLRKFDAISVRDRNSASIIEELTGKSPIQNLDPVLVSNIEKMSWKPCDETKFLIVYGYYYRFSEAEGKAISDFASKRDLKIINLCGQQSFGDSFVFCGPDEILGYFEKADYVVTDTFHGTIFSLLYHKPLAVFCRRSKDVSYSNENKLMDLLGEMGLESQCVEDLSCLEQILLQKIDYQRIDEIRNQERQNTMNYLRIYCGE